ncbi:hypothetical protein [Cystobacter ferrugineus]|uniref:hypothetical protein n=1 Tax=Cystobacter ferrugineus TaxID=83449 RepID=UPI001161125C|nr:hypothetical protein [Cystobacter ferrugineus]
MQIPEVIFQEAPEQRDGEVEKRGIVREPLFSTLNVWGKQDFGKPLLSCGEFLLTNTAQQVFFGTILETNVGFT